MFLWDQIRQGDGGQRPKNLGPLLTPTRFDLERPNLAIVTHGKTGVFLGVSHARPPPLS